MKKILIATLIALSATVAAASSVPLSAAAAGGHNKVQTVESNDQSSDVNTILSIVAIGAVIFGLSRKKF